MQPQQWTVPGAPVQGFVWAAPDERGRVLLSHGVGEYAGRYVERYHALIPTLVDAGFTVYSFDQRGHGTSGGRRAVVDMAVLVEDHLKAREVLRVQGTPLFLFGHSMGGLITAASAARDPRGVSGVVLSSPALLVGESEPALVKVLAPLLARIAPALPVTDLGTGGLSRLADEVAAYEADTVMYHGKVPALTGASMLTLSASLWPLYAAWTLPTLVVHGTADTITDPRGSQRFVQTVASTDKTLVLEDGGYHELLNDECREKVRGIIVDWLRAHAPG
ncbi:alpha-beta hydrolase superfamily lysophospholipase [Deinococcus metalli]|uniref:Hydrolase n=1 Tax=Deinococcus metalli TaxID=1141878 RepID=A0A7W8KB43_9DEIO|nr:alpha/beta hydrolase [Deinococcus metalli]MBB5374950.1 alpha-beta hydrolase superfamily lysophospholipase [Deinococcus metalli]GHF32511.1 hydrolase [Deinococcus metalli]